MAMMSDSDKRHKERLREAQIKLNAYKRRLREGIDRRPPPSMPRLPKRKREPMDLTVTDDEVNDRVAIGGDGRMMKRCSVCGKHSTALVEEQAVACGDPQTALDNRFAEVYALRNQGIRIGKVIPQRTIDELRYGMSLDMQFRRKYMKDDIREFSVNVPLCGSCNELHDEAPRLYQQVNTVKRGRSNLFFFLNFGVVIAFFLSLSSGSWAFLGIAAAVWLLVSFMTSARLRSIKEKYDQAMRVHRTIWRATEARRKKVEAEMLEDKRLSLSTLSELHNLSGHEFEELVTQLFRRMGYIAQRTRGSADGGVDIEAAIEGKERAIIQCKNYKHPVGPSVVRDLYGVVVHSRATSGILVCTSTFTDAAEEFAKEKPIRLVDGEKLLILLKEHELEKWPPALDQGRMRAEEGSGGMDFEESAGLHEEEATMDEERQQEG